KGECRLFARFPFKFSSPWPRRIMGLTPRWYSHISQNSILEDDQIFLHHQERYLAAAGGSDRLSQAFFLPTKADLFVLELHKWLREFQAQPFPEGTLPPALSKEQLLDRYHSHTVHCASCRQALTNIQRIRTGLAFGSVIAGCLLPWLFFGGPTALGLKVGASLLTLTLFGTWFGLGQFVRQFYEGRKTPPRNLPEKVKRSAR
ncbi:MAG TPA: cell death suppressor protein Lls1, partial [Stenomitos sp.]